MTCMASHTMPHMVPSVYSPGNCCCRRTPLRANALPYYPYDPGHMLAACPLTPVWSSLVMVSHGQSCAHSLLETLPKVRRKPRVSIRHYGYWYTMENLSNVKVIRTARKCADFVSRSTITHTASCPCGVRGKWVTKSIVTCSHFHSATSNG